MTSNIEKRHEPQIRLTVREVMQRREAMRSDQYLADVLAAMKKIGFTFRAKVSEFAAKIGMTLRSFQRARRRLIEAGRLVETHLTRDSIEFFLVPESDTLDVQGDTVDAQSDTLDVQGDTVDAMTCPEPALVNGLQNSPTLVSTTYINSLSVAEPEKRERGIEKKQTEEIEPEYKNWLHQQALKMPRAIGNIPVWIRSVAKRPEWRESFLEWFMQSEKNKCSAALSPSTSEDFRNEINVPTEEVLQAIQRAKASLRGTVTAMTSKNDRGLSSIDSYKTLGLGSV